MKRASRLAGTPGCVNNFVPLPESQIFHVFLLLSDVCPIEAPMSMNTVVGDLKALTLAVTGPSDDDVSYSDLQHLAAATVNPSNYSVIFSIIWYVI